MTTRHSLLAVASTLLLVAVPVHAQTQPWSTDFQLGKPAQPVTEEKIPAAPARVLAIGDKVRVAWSGGWYDATVLALGDGKYRIHYDGWDASWDEWVDASRIRLANGSAVMNPPVSRSPGSVSTPSSKLPTTVTLPKPQKTEEAQQPSGEKIWSSQPAGRWSCRTWDYGQINRVGEFSLNKDGTYRDLMYGGTGRYEFDTRNNTITFLSGPQKTSHPVRFNAAGHAGKGHLIFDYGGSARLDCYREALP